MPAHVTIAEPYCLLAEEGHEFAAMPGLHDFELQLERAIEVIAESEDNSIFDRCPADILAYLRTHRDAERFEIETWLPRSQGAMERLDLVVYVPVEEPDRIVLAETEDAGLRGRVDEELRDIVLGGKLGFDVDVLEVEGTPSERLSQVLSYLTGKRS